MILGSLEPLGSTNVLVSTAFSMAATVLIPLAPSFDGMAINLEDDVKIVDLEVKDPTLRQELLGPSTGHGTPLAAETYQAVAPT